MGWASQMKSGPGVPLPHACLPVGVEGGRILPGQVGCEELVWFKGAFVSGPSGLVHSFLHLWEP